MGEDRGQIISKMSKLESNQITRTGEPGERTTHAVKSKVQSRTSGRGIIQRKKRPRSFVTGDGSA